MDWSKAKNILIIAFIITNIFLLYNIKNNLEDANYFYSIDEERIQDVKEILESKNIIINTVIPQSKEKLPILTVEYEAYDPEEIAKKLLGSYELKGEEYINKNERVKLLNNNKLLIYEKNPEWFKTRTLSPEEAKEIANDFLANNGFMNENVCTWDMRINSKGQYEVIYSQLYNEKFLEDSYMKVVLDNVGVVYFERKWLTPIEEKGSKMKVIPSTTALLMAIDEIKSKTEGNYDKAVITEIKLGYLLDISKFDSLIKWYDMEMGDASPYWRITLEDKEHKHEKNYVFIEAYE